MTTTQTLLDLSHQQLKAASALVGELRAPHSSPGRPQCALFLTMVEQFEAALLLAQAGMGTHSAVHVRSMLEALVDQRCLGRNTAHVDRMRYEQLKGEKRLYERSLKQTDLPDDQREFFTSRLDSLLERFKPLFTKLSAKDKAASVADNFAEAGMFELVGYYTILCSFSHNDLAALALRHQGEKNMMLRAPVAEDVLFMILSLAHIVLVLATEPLRAFAKPPGETFSLHLLQMDQLQKQVIGLSEQVKASQEHDKSRP